MQQKKTLKDCFSSQPVFVAAAVDVAGVVVAVVAAVAVVVLAGVVVVAAAALDCKTLNVLKR